MTAQPLPPSPPPAERPKPKVRKPGIARARRVEEILRGNARAFRHGVFATVANAQDVDVEVALTFASHPLLDPIADRRLVEQYALNLVQRSRCIVAMQEHGLSAQLTSYDSRLAALAERLERAVYDRERERANVRNLPTVDLQRYRP